MRQTLHKFGGTLKSCISSFLKNNVCMRLRYSFLNLEYKAFGFEIDF